MRGRANGGRRLRKNMMPDWRENNALIYSILRKLQQRGRTAAPSPQVPIGPSSLAILVVVYWLPLPSPPSTVAYSKQEYEIHSIVDKKARSPLC